MSELRPAGPSLMAEVGELLVSLQVGDEDSDQLHAEYSDVLDGLRSDRSAAKALTRMTWVAAKAIERCRQLEGSDASDRAGRGDDSRPRDDVPAAVARIAPDACGCPTRSPAS